MIERIKIEYTNSIKVLNNIENINELVEKVLGEALVKEDIPYNFFVLVVFVSSDEIKEKNRIYREIDETTDVLSFPMFKKNEIHDIINYQKQKKESNETETIVALSPHLKVFIEDYWSIGEIYINLEKVEEQAVEYNHSVTRELAYVVTHGFYHLLGENHIDEVDKKVMREKEESLLNDLKIFRGNE